MKLILKIPLLLLWFVATPSFANWTCEITCRGPCTRGTVSDSGSTESSALSEAKSSCQRLISESECPGTAETSLNRCWQWGGGPPSGPSHYQIIFKNNCSKHGKIWSAINRLDPDGTWKTDGYWGLAYGETARVGITKNRTFYIHGHTDSGVTWGNGSGPWNVRGKSQPFSSHVIPDGRAYGEYTFSFGCN